MSEYILSCCSTADLPKEHFEKRDIKYICFHYKLNGVDYSDDLGQSIPFEEFYQRMDSGEDTQTSQINVTEYLEYFESFLSEGKDVIHLTLSSGISGSYNSAINAAKIAKERYQIDFATIQEAIEEYTNKQLLKESGIESINWLI